MRNRLAYPFVNPKRKAAWANRQRKDTPMREEHREEKESKGICYEALEEFAREKIRQHLQYLLEEEITEWLGREKSERKGNALEQPGYRNGYGKKRRFTLSMGTVAIQRPRVRDF